MQEYSVLYELSTQHFEQMYQLVHATWWGLKRTADEMQRLMKKSLPIVLVDNHTQDLIGFARVLTDEVRYAFIFDVVVVESRRGQGLGQQILKAIFEHPTLQQIKYFELTCAPDKVKFYERAGFKLDYTSNGVQVLPMRNCYR